MPIDDRIKEFGDRLDRSADRHRRQQERDSAEMAARFRRADTQQQAQVRLRRPSPGWPFTTPRQAQVALSGTEALQRWDRLMWQAFDLGQLFDDEPLSRYQVYYCETLEEFFTPFFEDLDCSDSTKAELIQTETERAKQAAGRGGIFGVNLPGRGCYINGWLFGVASGVTAREALQDPRIFHHILETICHEKLGHGFLAELTAVGQERTRLGMWQFDLAQRFALRTVDDPRGALLRQKHALIFRTTQYTEEGWATWIAEYMVRLAAGEETRSEEGQLSGVESRYTLERVKDVLENAQTANPDLHQAADLLVTAIDVLVVADEPPASAMLGAIRVWQEIARLELFDEVFGSELGQPMAYVLGYLLMRRLEGRLGWQNMPAAVAIAGNVTYNLEETSVADLAALVNGDPRLNVDARLALLGALELEPGQGPTELARQARETLNLAVPAGW